MNSPIDPRTAFQLTQEGSARLLDVRTPAEHGEIQIEGALLAPLDRLEAQALRTLANEGLIILVCRSGKRAEQAGQKLAQAGCGNFAIMEGGITAWEQLGLPVTRGSAAFSLERQVRIAAGLLVLTGVILGTWVHPAFYMVSAFVGAGLTFAGVTDWCGMALLLARMPWNQRSSSNARTSCTL